MIFSRMAFLQCYSIFTQLIYIFLVTMAHLAPIDIIYFWYILLRTLSY